MSFVSISASASTTPGIWYIRGERTDPVTGEEYWYVSPDRYYTDANGFTWPDSITHIIGTNRVRLNLDGTYYVGTDVYGHGILSAFEPYSVVDFRVDSNWRIESIDYNINTDARFGFCRRSDLLDYSVVNSWLNPGGSTYDPYSFPIELFSAPSKVFLDLWPIYLLNGRSTGSDSGIQFYDWAGTNYLKRVHNGMGIVYDSININDLLIFPISNSSDTVAISCKFEFYCPKSYVRGDAAIGDVFPGDGASKQLYPDEMDGVAHDSDQIESDKATMQEFINDSSDMGQWDDDLGFSLSSFGIGLMQPWMLKIFLVMMSFGVLGIFIRRSFG